MKKRNFFIALATVAIFLCAPVSMAANADDFQKRIDKLEEEIAILKEKSEDTTLDELKTHISGYTDVEYVNSNQPDSNMGFRLHHLSLFFKAKVGEKMNFFSEIEFEDAPIIEGSDSKAKSIEGKIFVESVMLDYHFAQELNARAGRFFTPAGIWSIDHYPPFVPTQERPLHIRKIFPQVIDGASAFGTYGIAKTFLDYNLYVGNGEGKTGSGDSDTDKGWGLRFSVLPPLAKYFELGGTVYKSEIREVAKKLAYGAHAKIKGGPIILQGEYAKADYEPHEGGDNYHGEGYYGQAVFDIWKGWSAGYRYDYFKQDSDKIDGQKRNSLFVNYRLNPNTVFKLEHHFTTEENPAKADWDLTIASVAVYFGL